MFGNYEEVEESYADKLYISNIRKLYPNMTEKEFNEMFENFKQEMKKQQGKPIRSQLRH